MASVTGWNPLTPRYEVSIPATEAREDNNGSAFTVYRVRAESQRCGNVTEVWRRFSEFNAFYKHLYAVLSTRVEVPKFPTAGWTDVGSKILRPDFVQKRRRALETFLQEVSKIETCVEHFIDFMSGDSYKPRVHPNDSLDCSNDAYAQRVLSSSAEEHAALSQQIDELRKQLENSDKKLREASESQQQPRRDEHFVVVSPKESSDSEVVAILKRDNNALSDEVASLKSKLEESREAKESAEIARAAVEGEINQLSKTVKRLENKSEEQAIEITHLQDSLASKVGGDTGDLAKAHATQRKLDKKITELTESNRDLKDKLAATEKSSVKNEQAAASMKKNALTMKERIVELERQLLDERARSETLEKELSARSKALDAESHNLNIANSNLETLRAQLKDADEKRREEVKSANDRTTAVEVELRVTAEKLAACQDENGALKVKVGENDAIAAKHEHQGSVLRKMTEQFKIVRIERDELKQKCEHLERDLKLCQDRPAAEDNEETNESMETLQPAMCAEEVPATCLDDVIVECKTEDLSKKKKKKKKC